MRKRMARRLPGPSWFNTTVLGAMQIGHLTNRCLQLPLVVGAQNNEAERLQVPAKSVQHLRRTKHQSATDQKHHFYVRASLYG